MNPWVFILLVGAAAVFGLDLLIRRKKWQNNSRGEKISLIIHMFSIGPHAFLSGLGMLWGLAAGSPETAFGQILYDVTLVLPDFILSLPSLRRSCPLYSVKWEKSKPAFGRL